MKKSFTLVELMIVIAILAILSAIVIFTLNPSRLFDNFRDTRRVSDIQSINKAIVFMESWNTSAINYGTNTTLYISLPDSSPTCSSYTLPTLPVGYIYNCKPTSTYKNSDGTGWIPIDFTVSNSNRYLSTLPSITLHSPIHISPEVHMKYQPYLRTLILTQLMMMIHLPEHLP